MNWAAAFGQLETVKWLSENRSEGCTEDAMGKHCQCTNAPMFQPAAEIQSTC